jgi:hypothetical protein
MEWVVNRQCDGFIRHGCLTTFDIFFDAKDVSLYMDGIKNQTFPKPNFRPRSLSFSSTWGNASSNPIGYDYY